MINIEYNESNTELTSLLQSIDRPGEFYAEGDTLVPMPCLEVADVGMLSFPILDVQIASLIEVAERAPFGKGQETIVDTSVRNCWQIDESQIQLGGRAWPKTSKEILRATAKGLGCPEDRLKAQLYKLLIYETCGFFTEHTDTEKFDGMIATLVLALPTVGSGGELVVRHKGREVVIDMNSLEPSELQFAAFYSDCSHEIKPVKQGHRIALVFNLYLKSNCSSELAHPPDYSETENKVVEQLIQWRDNYDHHDQVKLVWQLEHNYSTEGLSFLNLKNVDDAVARVLKSATARAGCDLYAAIVHIQEHGTLLYDPYYSRGEWDQLDLSTQEIDEIFDSHHWLDSWVSQDERRPDFGEIPLLPDELMPPGGLDDIPPDDEWLHEATGNYAASLERVYRSAALVIWPQSRFIDVIASGGIAGALTAVSEKFKRNQKVADDEFRHNVTRLIEIWPKGVIPRHKDLPRKRMLKLLVATQDSSICIRYLQEVMLSQFDSNESRALYNVIKTLDPDFAGKYLLRFIRSHIFRLPTGVLSFLLLFRKHQEDTKSFVKSEFMQMCVREILDTLPSILESRIEKKVGFNRISRAHPLGEKFVRNLYLLAWRCDMIGEIEHAIELFVTFQSIVTPDRTVPEALRKIINEPGIASSGAYAVLWNHSANYLLNRSEFTPDEPQDWQISSDITCKCGHCRQLRKFCSDPIAKQGRFSVRRDLRNHLRGVISKHRLDIDYETEAKGSPYTLICTKNRASYLRRLKEYAEDVSQMKSLIRRAPEKEQTMRDSEALEKLRVAVSRHA